MKVCYKKDKQMRQKVYKLLGMEKLRTENDIATTEKKCFKQ